MELRRFALRDLLWLVLVCAVVLGWVVDHRVQVSRAAHWRVQAMEVTSWVDKNCGWVDIGLTEQDEIVIWRNATSDEQAELLKSRWDDP